MPPKTLASPEIEEHPITRNASFQCTETSLSPDARICTLIDPELL
jgi:hypothetical protein